MRILIYCAHPAQYHFHKNIIRQLEARGHQIKLLIKSKDILETLVREDGQEYENILPEKRGNSKYSLFLSMIQRDLRVYKIARKYKPDILIGSDTSITHVGWLIKKPCFGVGEDDFNIVKRLNSLMMPFATGVLAPTVCNQGPYEKKKIPFDGYMKMAYLHPDVFQPDLHKINGIVGEKPFCLLRSVRLNAHHDKTIHGLNPSLISQIIDKLEKAGYRVFIDSEETLSADLAKYGIKIKKNLFHQVMACSSLVISDSQSISVEAALLGVPSIRFNDFAGKISVLEELEHKYHLTFGIPASEEDRLFDKIDELLATSDLRGIFNERRDRMLDDKINVLDFFVWFIDSFPDSLTTLKSKVADKAFMESVLVNDII